VIGGVLFASYRRQPPEPRAETGAIPITSLA